MSNRESIEIVMADDHNVLRKALKSLLIESGEFSVSFDTDNGLSLLEHLRSVERKPQVALLDISMPIMDGITTAGHIKKELPSIKVIALTMLEHEKTIMKMVRNGAVGYVLKGDEPELLFESIRDAATLGFTRSAAITKAYISKASDSLKGPDLNARQLQFCQECLSDLTYKEIAERMMVSPRTVDGYREDLFKLFNVKSRTGLVLHCLRNGIVELD